MDVYRLDKTWQEIYDAVIVNGKYPIVRVLVPNDSETPAGGVSVSIVRISVNSIIDFGPNYFTYNIPNRYCIITEDNSGETAFMCESANDYPSYEEGQ